ncbi:MAG: hypothetical protein LBQ40_01235 [Clostridiales bacterium]|jgi:hypothetical protein|nr:hypothetical protein [Clostridiales bacterium]
MREFFNVFYDSLKHFYSNVQPGLLYFLFLIIIAAMFVLALIFSGKEIESYRDAFQRAAAYLSDEKNGKIGKNNLNYFYKQYLPAMPLSVQKKVFAYFETGGGRPSLFITEADTLKSKYISVKKKTCFDLYDAVVFSAFLLVSAVSLSNGAAAFGIAALLPLSIGVILRYVLRMRYLSLYAAAVDGFHSFVDALDLAARADVPTDAERNLALKKASALIEELLNEERDAQRYRFANETDGLQREIRRQRLKEIEENVGVVCGDGTSLATLRQIFAMLADAKPVYKQKEETDIINGCLLKLRNAITRIERS